ncbi:response regulator [Roseateles koreensis]|uniref:Response regulator n=1 Tax=Roseateles koreensis TaxID=2987526 RepID=A0ABT5KTC9_9BURK|nr:response regulator [Roseateles koreensis]MDC8785680.1 response regulator [Roseateles koreensis]
MQQDSAPQRVLYVEDDRINIVLMEEVFRHLPDWQLICAETGAEALQLLQAGPIPVLALIDMNLPDTSGLELRRRLQRDPHLETLRCVALSADDDLATIEAAKNAGFCDYWPKPIEVRRFVTLLQSHLQTPLLTQPA